MKNFLLLSLLLATLGACQKEEVLELEAPATASSQTWQLVKSWSNWTNTTLTGTALTWQETYVFQADSTFTKTRQQGGQVSEARGTFSVRPRAGRQYAILTYHAATSLINSCVSRELKEHLVFTATDTLLSSSEACDGPRLEYKKLR